MRHSVNVTPVILCGGSGTRLWPLSRAGFPKQFLCFAGQDSLFQQAASRLMQLSTENIAVSPLVLVAGEEHRFLASEQLRDVGITLGNALLEPESRNTAPALTLAALSAQVDGHDPVLVVSPADHSIDDTGAFLDAIQKAIFEAAEGSIVILGITPDSPETGYGYIRAEGNGIVLNVRHFVEKPDVSKAQTYLDSGGYFWNSGMFVLKASVWLKAINQFHPDIMATANAAWIHRQVDSNFVRPSKDIFKRLSAISIDNAVMEHAVSAGLPIKMVPLNAGWSDLGAWEAVWEVLSKDIRGNIHVGDVISTDSSNTLVHAASRLVTLVGVDDLIVIETPDAVLVADRTHSQDVKQIVKTLSESGRQEHILHRKVQRPWGWYDTIDEGARFKVKRIQVNPGASLSLQNHQHRAEHWVVVKGTAEITNGNKKLLYGENQSTYIPPGVIHRLANPGTFPLEIIEVQSGSYLGEDDIVRFEDNYGRES